MSTKAPKSQIEETRPLRTSPSFSSSISCSFITSRRSWTAWRSERISRLRWRLISMTLSGSDGADQAGHVGLLAGLVATADLGDLRRRDEAPDAIEIHEETTLVVVGDFGLDDLVGLVQLLQAAPALLLAGAVDADDRVPLRVLGLDDKDENLCRPTFSACFSSEVRLEYSRAGTMPSDFDPMSTRSLVAVEVHDDPVHDIAILQGLVVMAGIVEELLHERGPEHVAIALRGDVGRRGSSSAGLSLLLANLRTVHTPSLVPTETRGLPCPCGSVLEPAGQERCVLLVYRRVRILGNWFRAGYTAVAIAVEPADAPESPRSQCGTERVQRQLERFFVAPAHVADP